MTHTNNKISDSFLKKVATLTTRYELADSQLNAAKSDAQWVTSNLTDVHQIATQLDAEKLNLQKQISDQALEIDSLNEEVVLLHYIL